MGVDTQDCMQVARLVGLKTFVNEFFAYEELSKLISNRVNGIEPSLAVRNLCKTSHRPRTTGQNVSPFLSQ